VFLGCGGGKHQNKLTGEGKILGLSFVFLRILGYGAEGEQVQMNSIFG